MHITPPCSDCSTATERIKAEGEEAGRCTAPDCTRRTYGAGAPDTDDALPPSTETDEDGMVIVYHGPSQADVEATAELAAQDGPDEDDLVDEEQSAPAAGAAGSCPASTPAVVHVPGAPRRGTVPTGQGRTAGNNRAPGTVGAPTAVTDSNGGAAGRPQLPQPGVGHALLPQCPAPSPREAPTTPAGGEPRPGYGAAVPRPAGGEQDTDPGRPAPGRGEPEADAAPTASGEGVPWSVLLADGETVARYHAHVLRRGPDECWWWTGGLTDTAHGTFRAVSLPGRTRRGTVPAHLFGYRLAHGPDSLPAGLVVRHTCDEPPCQNPAHWLIGTRGDNNRDAASRRRLAGHALADVRGAVGRARAVQAAIAAARPEELDAAIAAALAAGNPSGAHQDALF